MKQFARKLAVITALTCSLQGCFVVGAAAGAAAIAVVYDHRTIDATLQDNKIANKISDKINRVSVLRNDSHIEVTVFNDTVLLTGQTPSTEGREKAGEIAKMYAGNTARIYNQITIQGPTSTLTRTSDTWISTKIRSLMLAKEDLKSSTIKVVTENGTVYLMGVVKRQQADVAVDIARQVSGVQRVIKIFQYQDKPQD
jgi:osmotically-inducible protein OsmY